MSGFGFRWWLWEQLDWLSYLVCPDKKMLLAVRRVGYVKARQIIEEAKRAQAEGTAE